MAQIGPQYAINDDEEICVRLTEEGMATYRRIYFGKPKLTRMEKRDDGYYQYYKCSKEQGFLYFRKFDPTVVQIIAPETLRTRMKMFYASGVKAYDSQNSNRSKDQQKGTKRNKTVQRIALKWFL